jgi:HlyD family secretion protein
MQVSAGFCIAVWSAKSAGRRRLDQPHRYARSRVDKAPGEMRSTIVPARAAGSGATSRFSVVCEHVHRSAELACEGLTVAQHICASRRTTDVGHDQRRAQRMLLHEPHARAVGRGQRLLHHSHVPGLVLREPPTVLVWTDEAAATREFLEREPHGRRRTARHREQLAHDSTFDRDAVAAPRNRCAVDEAVVPNRARREATRVARLASMGEAVRAIESAPAEPGMHEPAARRTAPSTARAQARGLPVGKRRALKIALAVAIVAAAGGFAAHMLTRAAEVPLAQIERENLQEQTVGPGTIQSRYPVAIGVRVAGTIDRVLVDVGDEVERGQLLATLDHTELEARAAAARAAVVSARRDIALARANLAKARSSLTLASADLRRDRELLGAGVATVAELDRSEAAFAAGKADQLAAAAVVDARRAALTRAIEDERVAATVLSYAQITSPTKGVVTRRALEPGSAVTPGGILFQIVDAEALWVATLLDQSVSGRIELGQRATIRLRSGAQHEGYVARIGLEADPVTRELEIDVAFAARPGRFAIHEEADVTIFGREVEDVVVPLAAVDDGPDGSSVYVVVDGRAQRRPVRLGITGSDRAQVVDGVAPGDSLVLTPAVVRDGQRVVGEDGR